MDTISRMTVLTLKWIYDTNKEKEFLQCTTVDEIKAFVWKYMKPLSEKNSQKLSRYSIDRMDYELHKDHPNKLSDSSSAVFSIKTPAQQLESFKKGIHLVDFRALLEYIRHKNREQEVNTPQSSSTQEGGSATKGQLTGVPVVQTHPDASKPL